MTALRTPTVVLMLAILAEGGMVRPDAGLSSAAGSGPRVTVVVGNALGCGTSGACCCVAAEPVRDDADSLDGAASMPACCKHAEPDVESARENDGLCHAAVIPACTRRSPLCQCTAERRVPLEESLPVGLPSPQADADFCDAAPAENRLASDELTVATRFSSVLTSAAPLPLPVLLQLATLCCWRA